MTETVGTAVELEHVSLTHLTWGTRVDALNEVSLHLPSGSWAIVSGENGSGKSSLLRVIAGIERPTAGHVRLFDKPLQSLSAGRRSALVSYVRQHPDQGLAPSLTIHEHAVGYGYDAKRFRHRLDELGLDDAFPFLVDAGGRPIETLSGGERQVLGIVLQLVRKTPLLLLDEAFSALDPRREARVLDALDMMKTRSTIVQVTHQPERLRDRASYEIRMAQGRIVEQGGIAHAG